MQRQTGEKYRKYKTEKVVYRNRKRQKRIGSENTKIKKYMFHLENKYQQTMKKTMELRYCKTG